MENSVCRSRRTTLTQLTVENFVERSHRCTMGGELQESSYLSKDTVTYGVQGPSEDGGGPGSGGA